MKNLKTVFLLFASLFLFFSCANDFEGGSAYVRIDPSIFNRSADDGGCSYVVAIMGEGMEPVWKSGRSGISLTLEFTDLPVGQKAFVFVRLDLDNEDQNWYIACSDDFIIKRGIQSVKLKLKNISYGGSIPEPLYFDCDEESINKRSIDLSVNQPSGAYAYSRVSFTVSDGSKSEKKTVYLENYITLWLSLDYSRYTISNFKVESFGGTGNSWGYKIYQSPDTIIYERKIISTGVTVFEPITQFSF